MLCPQGSSQAKGAKWDKTRTFGMNEFPQSTLGNEKTGNFFKKSLFLACITKSPVS